MINCPGKLALEIGEALTANPMIAIEGGVALLEVTVVAGESGTAKGTVIMFPPVAVWTVCPGCKTHAFEIPLLPLPPPVVGWRCCLMAH